MNAVTKVKNVLIKTAVTTASIALLCMLAIIVIEVLLRFFLDKSTLVSTDFASYLLGITFFWGGLKAFEDGVFVRVDVLYEHFKGKFKKFMTILFDFVFLFFLCNVTYYFGFMLEHTITKNIKAINIYETPLVYPRTLLFIGMITFILYFFCRIIEDIMAPIQKHSAYELRKMSDQAEVAEKIEFAEGADKVQEEVSGV